MFTIDEKDDFKEILLNVLDVLSIFDAMAMNVRKVVHLAQQKINKIGGFNSEEEFFNFEDEDGFEF